MKKVVVLMTLAALTGVFALKSTVNARPKYEEKWLEKNYDPKSKDPNVKKLADAIEKIQTEVEGKKQSCNVCHIEGKNKKERNSYGKELGKNTGKNQKDEKKIIEAIEKTGKEKSPAGPTWEDILKKGALPISGEKEGATK
jgi:hypothetical protein